MGLPGVTLTGGGTHDKLNLRRLRVSIPRHKEIPLGTCISIMRAFEVLFGEGWWKND